MSGVGVYEQLGYTMEIVRDLDGDGVDEIVTGGAVDTLHVVPAALVAGVTPVTDLEIGRVVFPSGKLGPDGSVTSADLDGDGANELVVGIETAVGTYAAVGALYRVP